MTRAIVFDAYGTLFDVASAARAALADDPAMAAAWPALAEDWRRKQLEYSWLRSLMGVHAEFRQVTAEALDWALAARGIAADRARLMALYDTCAAFPEVPGLIAALRARGLALAVLSNGAPGMLAAAVSAAGLEGAFDAVISAEDARIFKPDGRVYALVERRLGVPPGAVLFVSSNGWDAAGAAGFGFPTVWVNRSGAPVDRLPHRPRHAVRSLTDLPDILNAPPTLRFFTTSDGLRLAFDDRGAGVPLVCLAGLTRNMEDYAPILAPLGGRARLLRLDCRGRGRSAHDPDCANYNVIREARDVLELLDHLGIGRAVFLGTSRGGLVTMALAAAHRDRIAGAILNDIGPEVGLPGLARIMEYVGLPPVALTLDEAAAATHAAMAADFAGVPRATWRAQVAGWYTETPLGLRLRYDPGLRRALIAQGAAGAEPDLWRYFGALAGLPVAVIRGANSDVLSPATLAEMVRRHPGLIVAEVPDRGHVPFLDEPQALAAIHALLDRCRDAA